MKSILIKDTTREERIAIVNSALGEETGCDYSGLADEFYRPYIDGEKEIAELNMSYNRGMVKG